MVAPSVLHRNSGMDRAIAREGRADWIFQTLLGELAGFGDHPALIAVEGDAVSQWSFAELADRASRLASGLLRQRSEEHTSELQSIMRISYSVFCWKKKKDSNRTAAP